MLEEDRLVIADDHVDRQVLVAGDVQQQAGERGAATVGLLVPALGAHQAHHGVEQLAAHRGKVADHPLVQVHTGNLPGGRSASL